MHQISSYQNYWIVKPVKDFLAKFDRINRIHLQNDITVNTDFLFPRIKNTKRPSNRFFNELPNKVQIFEQIEKSKCDAIRDAIKIGLIEKDSVERISFACQVAPVSIKAKKNTVVSEGSLSISSTLLRREAIILKNYAEKFTEEEVPETSSYVQN